MDGAPFLHLLDFVFHFLCAVGIEPFYIRGKLVRQSQKFSGMYTFLVRYILRYFHRECVIG